MKNSIFLSIPKPCHEKWQNFSPTSLGGFCSGCQKEVIDFTAWDEEKIKAYFKNPGKSTCGRFRLDQLKIYPMHQIRPPGGTNWWPVSLLSLTMMLSANHSKAQEIKKPAQATVQIKNTIKVELATHVAGPQHITGTVNDSYGQPIPGVNVILKGSSLKTFTDGEGNFAITIVESKPSDTLSFSFIGYRILEKNIREVNNLSVMLEEDLLGELTVVRRWSPRGIFWKFKNLFRW